MTSFKLISAALAVSALVATPASAWEAISEPAAAATDPNFSIYSGDGNSSGGFAYSRAITAQPFNPDARAEMLVPMRPHSAHRAPARHY